VAAANSTVIEVQPPWPFRLPAQGGMDGVLRHRGGVLERLMHHGEEPVVVRVAQRAPDRVAFAANAPSRAAAEHGIARMRFALGVDEDLRAFHERFARDPAIGESVRRRPWLRVRRRPEPFEALAWAICEQLIEFERAAAIERRIVMRLGRQWSDGEEGRQGRRRPEGEDGHRGRRWPDGEEGRQGRRWPDGEDGHRGRRWPDGEEGHQGRRARAGTAASAGSSRGILRDVPSATALAGVAPALLQSLDLGGARARTLVRAAREVARGRIDLHGANHERTWQRLRAIPGIGAWTVEMLALHGQGRHDQVPAGDVGLLKLVGRTLSGGDPHARAQEHEVRAFFAPYGEWVGMAAAHLMTVGS
jgi:3-methyladenine DNA glycosylase/8-oxoguanine DNA glycosylase